MEYKRIILAKFAAIVLLLFPVSATAEDETSSDFELMKAQATDKSIPLVNITTNIDSVTKAEYTGGMIEIFDLQARTNNEQSVRLGCKVKYRGGTSLGFDKKSFAIKTLDTNGEKCDVNIFGIREDDSWILDAMAIDRLRMRNRLCFDLWNEIGYTPYDTDYGNRNGTKGVFVEVFINGDYHGLYCLTDKINRKLLGLKKIKENEDGSVSVRGVLYKGESWTDATQLYGYDSTQPFDTDTWNGWELQYPDDYPSVETWQPLMDFIDVFQLSSDAFASVYDEYLYTDNLISYALLVMATNYGDNMMKNTFLSNPITSKSSKFLVTPWDMDMSLGGYWNGEYYDVLANLSTIENSRLFNALLTYNIDGFKDNLCSKWEELCKTVFSPDSVYGRIDKYTEIFTASGAWQREYNKWNGNPVALYEDVADEASYVKGWYARNFQNVCNIFGIETGIANVSTKSPSEKNAVYTLGGIRLNSQRAAHGVVIQNGKKILRK